MDAKLIFRETCCDLDKLICLFEEKENSIIGCDNSYWLSEIMATVVEPKNHAEKMQAIEYLRKILEEKTLSQDQLGEIAVFFKIYVDED